MSDKHRSRRVALEVTYVTLCVAKNNLSHLLPAISPAWTDVSQVGPASKHDLAGADSGGSTA